MSLRITPRNLMEDYSRQDPPRLVTDPNPLTNDGKFTHGGVFSERIFGNMNNSIEYACDCGQLQGEFNRDEECPTCHTKVVFKGLQLSREGWIDLQIPVIHPVFYQYIKKIIGPTQLKNILAYKPKALGSGQTEEPPLEPPFTGIGMLRFQENLGDVLSYFLDKRKDKDGKKRINDYNFLAENEEMIFTDKFPVVNSRLRPALMVNGEFSFDAINTLYNNLIKNAELASSFTDIELTDINILTLANRNQQIVNDLYQAILESLSNKEGFIRGSLVGSRMNLSSRCVIGPLPGEYGMDECVLPYQAALELMKPMLIRKIMKIKRVAASEAHRQWFKASQSYNRFIHTLMRDIAKNDNIRILLNRNPTISVGSILALRIADVKADMDDFTLNINNLILPSLSGDYDGDVLNILLIVSKAFVEFFDRFRPSNLVMDCETGRFNRNFAAFKDIALGLETVANL